MAYDQLVLLNDDGNPKTFSAFAEAVVSGGWLVQATSTNINVVGSNADTYNMNDVHVQHDTGKSPIGVALQDTAISGAVAVLKEGILILPVGSNPVTAGSAIMSSGYLSCIETCPDESGAKIIGRALTTGSHGTPNTVFSIVHLRA